MRTTRSISTPQMWTVAAVLCALGFSIHSEAKSYQDAGGRAMTIKVGISAPSLGLNIREREPDPAQDTSFQLSPHAKSFSYLSVAYDWWGFSLSSVNPTADEDDRLKGKSVAQDWQFRFNFEKTSWEFFYQNYEGYYLENNAAIYPRTDQDPFLQYPNLRTEHFGGNFLYNWNPDDFSISAAMDQTERQTASSWGWLLGASLHGMRFANSGAIPPPSVGAAYGEFNTVRSGRLASALVGAGLGGTWVPAERFFVSGLAITYFGYETQNIETTGAPIQYSGAATKFHVKMSLGYNGDVWMSGLTANSDAAKYNVTSSEMEFTVMAVQIFVGRRFSF